MDNVTERELKDLLTDYDQWRAERAYLTARMDQGEHLELFDSDDDGLHLLDLFAATARDSIHQQHQ